MTTLPELNGWLYIPTDLTEHCIIQCNNTHVHYISYWSWFLDFLTLIIATINNSRQVKSIDKYKTCNS